MKKIKNQLNQKLTSLTGLSDTVYFVLTGLSNGESFSSVGWYYVQKPQKLYTSDYSTAVGRFIGLIFQRAPISVVLTELSDERWNIVGVFLQFQSGVFLGWRLYAHRIIWRSTGQSDGPPDFWQTFFNGLLKAWSLYIPHLQFIWWLLPVLKSILPSTTLRSKISELN